jgi:virginiamycin B lyase
LVGELGAWAADAAGRIWLTVRGTNTLVRIEPAAPDPASTLAVVASPIIDAPDGVWLGEDGGIWFANAGANSIARLDPTEADPGATIETYGGPPEVDEPFDIKDGPDGWLWFTNKSGNSLGRIYAGAD